MDNKITKLENQITDYATKYYLGEAEITDEEFDKLVDELREINPNSEILKTPGWGYNPDKTSERKCHHKYGLMIGSLEKVKEFDNIPSEFINPDTRISAKLDGLSVVSYYENGKRILAVTRGNGELGLDVTDKMTVISPETDMITEDFTGAIRGEVIISNETWSHISEEYEDNPSANQRNIAAGILNRKDITEELEYLDYVVYKIIASEDNVSSLVDSTVKLIDLGFKVVPSVHFDKDYWSSESLLDYFNEVSKLYPCDGLVFTRQDLTMSDKRVNYDEIAYKFPAESKEVIVTKVEYNLTRTGRLVPLIWFDPVELSGAMVRKCTGFNAQFIRDNKINTGSVIEVCRSGEVIPYLIRVVTPSNEGYIPQKYDGDLVTWSGTDLIVENYEGQCAYHFLTTAAPCDGAGFSLYSQLCDIFKMNDTKTLIEFLKDFRENPETAYEFLCYYITGSVTRGKAKSILKMLLKDIEPCRFLVACGIHGVSWNTAETLVAGYPEFFEDLNKDNLNKIRERLSSLSGFGERTVENIMSKISFIKDLLKYVSLGAIETKPEAKFKVAITGALSIKRAEFDKLLQEHGIEQSGNFKEIKYLITNNPDSTSSKMNNAKKYGVAIISEKEFIDKYFGVIL